LVAFSVAYLAGAALGARIRIDGLVAHKSSAPAFPWSGHSSKPPTIDSALEWLALQDRLRQLGYADARIAELYQIQADEWKQRATSLATAKEAIDRAGSGASSPARGKTATDVLLEEWLKRAQSAAPFANQPAKELADKLEKLNKSSVAAMPS
jgi:hypothetical protein